MKVKPFSPLVFLASLGAGGISVMPFAFMQYTVPHAKGLVKIADIAHGSMSMGGEILFRSLEGVMLLFTFLHIVMSVFFFKRLFSWLKGREFKEMLYNPLANAALLAPFISITMTMNTFIGPIRFFIPSFASNLQTFMLPALIFWIMIWTSLMFTEIKLLKISFAKGFDVEKVSFGWLLHPFALGMATVTGMGIAALSKNHAIADIAVFLSLTSGVMGMFLLAIKLMVIFKSHFAADDLPAKQFLPSFLIVIPNITLYAISAFRFGHYLEHSMGIQLKAYFFFVVVIPFAFEVWYMVFGLFLLKDYFKNHFFEKEFYVTQWGLGCPIVAFGVLGSFVYKMFAPYMFTQAVVLASIATAVVVFFILLKRHMTCAGMLKGKNFLCHS